MKWASLALLCCGCFTTGYLTQAAAGQYDLLHRARPISKVLADPSVSDEVKQRLAEVDAVKDFGRSHGLTPTNNYQRYSDLKRDAAVYVVQACAPLSFEVKRWNFPIVGSVPYLGFFAPAPAKELAQRLERDEHLDVSVRTASAYSTLGWFRDPVLSTMIPASDDAAGSLANTILHESVHATVYLKSQSSFDESLASFVADRLTPGYLAQRYGFYSPPVRAWFEGERRSERYLKRMHQAYVELDALYKSSRGDEEKLGEKKRILEQVREDLGMKRTLNNAALAGFQTYAASPEGFGRLLDACGSVPKLMQAVATLKDEDFEKPQQSEFDGVLARLAERSCH